MSNPLQPLLETRVLAILRGLPPDQVIPLASALAEGGIRALEVTLDSPGALESIRLLRQLGGPGMVIGAGTVLDAGACERAIAAGAQLVVTPGVLTDVAAVCREDMIPCLLGASTPTEVLAAHRAGSTMVKFFPAATLGPDYLKAMKAPLAHIPILATGGVSSRNATEFLQAGADAVGVGGSLVDAKMIAEGQWHVLTERAKELIAAVGR